MYTDEENMFMSPVSYFNIANYIYTFSSKIKKNKKIKNKKKIYFINIK